MLEVVCYIFILVVEIDFDDLELCLVFLVYNCVLLLCLMELIVKYCLVFIFVGYYLVDGFSYCYWKDCWDGGCFILVIEECYCFVDEEFGMILVEFEESLGIFNFIVVSDYGFDFGEGYYILVFVGIFFGWGFVFDVGWCMDGLYVFDMVLMMFDFVGMLVVNDMLGVELIDGELVF